MTKILFSFGVLLVVAGLLAQSYPAGAVSGNDTSTAKEWKTSYFVGKFGRFDKVVLSDPQKPDQIFKVYYRVINGTTDDFSATPLRIVSDVSSDNGSGTLEVKFPRNYPYTDSPEGMSTGANSFTFFMQHPNEREEGFYANSSTTDCFFVFSIPFTDRTRIAIIGTSLLQNYTFHGDRVPSSCIPDTVVSNVITMKDGTISPFQQFKTGVAAKDIACKEDLKLIINPKGKPYCATEETIKFLNRVWYK